MRSSSPIAASPTRGGRIGSGSAYARELEEQMRQKKEREDKKKREDADWDLRKEREAVTLAAA